MANSVSHARLPYPIINARFTVAVPFLDADGDPTDPTTPDTEISQDGGSFADAAEEVTTITGSNGAGYITLTGAEMNNSLVVAAFKVASGPKATLMTLYPRNLPILESGTAGAGASGTITLASGTYTGLNLAGCFIRTTGGTGGGGTGGANNQARRITSYNTSTRVATVTPNWETTPSSDTTYDVLLPEGVTVPMLTALAPTTLARTLDVSSGGEAGLDWANIGSPTTTVNLSGTTVKDATDVNTDTDTLLSRMGTPSNLGGGATLAANLSDIESQTDDIGSAGAGLTALASASSLASLVTTVGVAGAGLTEAGGTGDQFTAIPWNASWDAEVQSEVSDELTARGYSSTRAAYLDNISAGAAALQSSVDDLESRLGTPTDLGSGATVAANLVDIEAQTDDIGAAGAGLTALATAAELAKVPKSDSNVTWNATALASVNAEVVDALATDTYAEPSAVPAATSSLKDKINWMFSLLRNKRTQTSGTETLFRDDGSTTTGTSTKSDDGTTLTRGEWT